MNSRAISAPVTAVTIRDVVKAGLTREQAIDWLANYKTPHQAMRTAEPM